MMFLKLVIELDCSLLLLCFAMITQMIGRYQINFDENIFVLFEFY